MDDFDPDATLAELLDISRADQSEFNDEIHALAKGFLALHAWLSEGGTLPSAWHLATCMSRDCRAGEVS